MYRLAQDGYEKSMGKDHVHTKEYARNLARLLEMMGRQTDSQKVLIAYPQNEGNSDWDSDEGDDEVDDEVDDDEDEEESSAPFN